MEFLMGKNNFDRLYKIVKLQQHLIISILPNYNLNHLFY